MLQSPVKPVQYHWVPAASISDNARRAVVAAEDQKFWTHNGFDMDAIHKAEQYNLDHPQRRRGASSISQQTAKNLFLWPGGYVRKGIEAVLTVLIEKIWGKDRILEMYLNIAEFGPGIYGVEAASQNFFGKPAATLTPEEAARLAAVLPNPRHWSVRAPGAYVQTRTAWILGQMGYPSPGAPREEPEPPASELPDADAAGSQQPDAPLVAPAAPQAAPADAAPAAVQPPSASSSDQGEATPPPPAAAPEPPPTDPAKPPP
jgi:monofunctional biosynthetic peptidoglycan transglycosylase